ncbi:hypothetical protein [Acuticoccus sediminis]|nr:hypothetical protein [Acuticoccus sediminis]
MTDREKALLERLRDKVLAADHAAMREANVLPMQRVEPAPIA